MSTTYRVPGIHCENCKASVEDALNARDDVERALVDVEERTVTVEGQVSDAAVAEELLAIGYADTEPV